MAGTKIALSLGMVLLTMQLWAGGSMAQSDCSAVLISLSPCMDYISGEAPTPPQECCTPFASVVRSKPACLCQLLNGGGSSFGVEINETRALALPTACNVVAPPASRCKATSPTKAPLGSQEPNTPTTPGRSAGSEPATPKSNGSSVKVSMSMLFFLLLITASFCAATMRC